MAGGAGARRLGFEEGIEAVLSTCSAAASSTDCPRPVPRRAGSSTVKVGMPCAIFRSHPTRGGHGRVRGVVGYAGGVRVGTRRTASFSRWGGSDLKPL